MKEIGLIGGMSWESSQEYLRIINETTQARLGGLHSAKTIMYSVDFAEIADLQKQGDWDQLTEIMISAGIRLRRAGADFLVICTNTMHKMADEVENASGLPLLHIADTTGKKIQEQQLKTVGLLGTKFTMEEDFYRKRLEEKYGLEVLIPEEEQRDMVHQVIFEELCKGIIDPHSKSRYEAVMDNLRYQGAEGIILGCTEIPLLVSNYPYSPLFDTTRIHAEAAVDYALTD